MNDHDPWQACIGCIFWHFNKNERSVASLVFCTDEDELEEVLEYAMCRRFPKQVETHMNSWCGECCVDASQFAQRQSTIKLLRTKANERRSQIAEKAKADQQNANNVVATGFWAKLIRRFRERNA